MANELRTRTGRYDMNNMGPARMYAWVFGIAYLLVAVLEVGLSLIHI